MSTLTGNLSRNAPSDTGRLLKGLHATARSQEPWQIGLTAAKQETELVATLSDDRRTPGSRSRHDRDGRIDARTPVRHAPATWPPRLLRPLSAALTFTSLEQV